VVDAEKRELEKLESILTMERQKATDRSRKLAEIEKRDQEKSDVARSKLRERESNAKERNKLRGLRAK
jgi:hypothetical protein